MFNKYSRNMPSVYLDSDENSSEWYKDFISNLEKSSTQSQNSIYNEISSILGNTKSKYSTVDEAVQDMSERTGLKAFLNLRQVLASIQTPQLFQKLPQVKTFIDNFIKDRPGTSIESVVHELVKMNDVKANLEDGADVDDEVKAYINAELGKITKKDDNSADLHLGKVDQTTPNTSDDPLAICEPNHQ